MKWICENCFSVLEEATCANCECADYVIPEPVIRGKIEYYQQLLKLIKEPE